MSNQTEIKFNKEQANYGIEQLKQSQKELYEADKLFYKGIMALASAKGMDLILKEDSGINLYLPEKIVIECREEITHLIEDITTKIALVEGFNDESKESTSTVQYRNTEVETVESSEEISVSRPIQALYAPPGVEVGEGSVSNPIQALYAPPGVEVGEEISVSNPIQALYAPPGVEVGEEITVPGPVQALYAPPGVVDPGIENPTVQPMYGVITPEDPIVDPIVQPMYGVITPENPIVDPVVQPMYGVITPENPIVDPIVQPMYGVITPEDPIVDPVIQPMYGVITPDNPVVEPIVSDPVPGPIQALYAPPSAIDPGVTAPDTNPTLPEYETIPNTGVPGIIEKNYVSKHPKLIGGLAATMGIFGIPTILSDDYDEEEEKRINKKEDLF